MKKKWDIQNSRFVKQADENENMKYQKGVN